LIECLRRRFGIDSQLDEVRDMAILRLHQPATERFHALIAPYMHPSLERKLLPKYRGRFMVEPEFVEPERRLVPAPIASIHRKPPTWNGRRRYRYDLEVEGTHNYLVDGVVVHNSPETTSGGKALKFYASIRLDIRPIEPIKNGTDIIGRRVRVKVVKNKVSPPFRIAELEILAAEGISREGGLLDMGVTTGVLDKSGAWINYGKARIGQGREAAKQFLREHADVANEIEAKVRERSGAAAVVASPDGEEG
jgi:recombination protein RecA